MKTETAYCENSTSPREPGADRPAMPRPVFSHELKQLAQRFADKPARLEEILQATQGRGFDLLLVCICLPFITPIPLPGLSTPLGLLVTLIGIRLAAGRKPWLPRRFLNRELPPQFLSKMLKAASGLVRVLEFCLRPRMRFLQEWPVFRRVSGSLILVSGLLLVLPVPLPFCNSLPALTVVLLAAAALEHDGIAFLAGCFIFLVTAAYFGLLAFGGAHAVQGLKEALFGG